MDNQHRKIVGYRELTQSDIDLMNRIKKAGRDLLELVDEVDKYIVDQYRQPNNNAENPETYAELDRLDMAEPFKWKELAKTDIQIGTMSLVRAVAQPTDC